MDTFSSFLDNVCTTFLLNLYSINLQASIYNHVFTCRVEKSVNPDYMMYTSLARQWLSMSHGHVISNNAAF